MNEAAAATEPGADAAAPGNRLGWAHVVAFIAAIALMFVMALDWYSSAVGEEARRIEEISEPSGALGGEVERRVQEDARFTAEGEERNAWQGDELIDTLILVLLIATVVITIVAVLLRASGRRSNPPWTPSLIGALVASAAALLVAYRMWQEPGLDQFNTVEAGAPLAIVVLGVIALALATAFREEDREDEATAPPAAEQPA